MKYYIVSDVHGYYTEMHKALESKGFFNDTEPHKLIVCGDMMDRGNEAFKMQNFMLDLLKKDELIFIRGNHEDLFVDMLDNFEKYEYEIVLGNSHHCSNGTWDTALQLTNITKIDAYKQLNNVVFGAKDTPFYQELIPASVDYFEIDNYIFVHGWIPCITQDMPTHYRKNRTYKYNNCWRNAKEKYWDQARWFNGMELANRGIIEPDKTIVCGHWHTSYGHANFLNTCNGEFEKYSIFTPYYNKGIIAIDACTAHTRFVNCIVIKD